MVRRGSDATRSSAPPPTGSPLTRSQSYYWLQYLQLAEGERAKSNIILDARLPAGTSADETRRALAEIARRHHALRSSIYLDEDGTIRQRWHDDVAIDLRVHEVDSFAVDRVQSIVAEASSAPADLTAARPLRSVLLMAGDGARLLLIVVPHIFADGSTSSILEEEIGTIVADLRGGRQPGAELPEPAQNAEIAERECSAVSQRRSANALTRWRNLLAEALNTSFPYRDVPDDRPEFFAVCLDGAGFGRTVAAASKHIGVAEEVFLLGTLSTLIGRYTGLRASGWQVPFRKLGRPTRFFGPNVQKGFCTLTEPTSGVFRDTLTNAGDRLISTHASADYDEFALLDERILAETARRTSVWFDCFFDCVLARGAVEPAADSIDRPLVKIECLSDGHLRFMNVWPLAVKVRGGVDIRIRLTAHRRAMSPVDAANLLRGLVDIAVLCADGGTVTPELLAERAHANGWPRHPEWTSLPSRRIWVDLDRTRRIVEEYPGIARADVHADSAQGVSCVVWATDRAISTDQLSEYLFGRLAEPGVVVPDRFQIRLEQRPSAPGRHCAIDLAGRGRSPESIDAALEAFIDAVAVANDIRPPAAHHGYVAAGGRVCRVPAVNRELHERGWRELPLPLFLGHRSLRTLSTHLSRRDPTT